MVTGTRNGKGSGMEKQALTGNSYFDIKALNCSMIKLFDSDPIKFFEQYKLGKKKKDSKGTSILIGDIVDFFLLECGGNEELFNSKFEEKYTLFEDIKGSGQAFILADMLFEIAQGYLDENDQLTVSFTTLFTEGFKKIQGAPYKKYSGKTEAQALEDFYDKAYTYYKHLIENIGKPVVDSSLLDKSRTVAGILVEDDFTRELFKEKTGEDVITKFAIQWNYKLKSGALIECKSEIDMMRINHKEKVIYLKDLKTTYDNENFETAYLKYAYYLQAAFYRRAVEFWANQEGMGEYDITPMEFIVGDTSINNRRPIRYQLSEADMIAGTDGFILRGVKYRGIDELMEEIAWCEAHDVWDCSQELHINNGISKLNLQYE